MKKPRRFRNESGQVIIENVLLLVVLFGVFTAIIDFLRANYFNTTFTQQPWAILDGMIQCGNWTPCGIKRPKAETHPNSQNRVLSLDPNVVTL